MLNDIKAIKKTYDHTSIIIKKLMDSGEFDSPSHAFAILRATLKALRDRIGPGEAMQLAGQLPALLRGFYYEDYDLRNAKRPISSSRSVELFLGEIKDHLEAYDFMELETVVPIVMNVIFDSIDQGEAEQVIHQLPKEVQDLRAL